MRVTLLVDVDGWGKVGDVRSVREGPGADHLIAEGVVAPLSAGGRKGDPDAEEDRSRASLRVLAQLEVKHL